jgi:DNA-binding CsgD family transcriptional regulator/tetratricopeptide (TPR) repeat protein
MLKFELFRYRICGILRNSVLLVLVMLLSVDCSRINDGKIRGRKAVDATLDMAEKIMDDNAPLADSLMNLIDSHSIHGKERQARYALLYTAAEYKNYQIAPNDSLIMMAVRYYSISNDLDYRFMSYYYLGCVYSDLGKTTDATGAFTQAEQLVDMIDNKYWKGLLYNLLGELFTKARDFRRAGDYYVKAEACFESTQKELHRLHALYRIGESRLNLHDFKAADSITRIVEQEIYNYNDSFLITSCTYNRLYCAMNMNEPDSATVLLNRYLSIVQPQNTFGYFEMMALYFNTVKEYSKSESYLKQAEKYIKTRTDSIYFYYTSSLLAECKGQTDEALMYYREYTLLQNSSLNAILSQPILAVQKEQYRAIAENEQLKYNHARLTLILCVVIFLLILVIVLVTYHYKKKRMKEQLYDSLAVVEELSGRIEDLKNQVRVQFHERHDISNRLYSMYFDSTSQDKVTKQQLNVTINSLIKDYTAPDSVRKLDKLLNDSYDDIMNRLSDPEIGLTDKELELFRYSFAGLSSKAISVIIKESPQNIYQIKSRLLKKVRRCSEELWSKLDEIW